MPHQSNDIVYKRLYQSFEKRLRRKKGIRKTWNAYDAYRVTGHYKRDGSPKLKSLGKIVGCRGEWYKVTLGRSDPKLSGPHKTRNDAATARASSHPNRKRKPTRKYYGVRRSPYGDDIYSWDVYDKRTGRTVYDGESRHQAGYLADRLEQQAQENACNCREPKPHKDCAYCGVGYWGPNVCGVCREAGIDGPVIRGTERRVCSRHKDRA